MNKKSLLALSIISALSQGALAQTISGTIVDKSGHPVNRAKVSVDEQQNSVLTNQQGQFSLTGLNPGAIELHITAKQFTHVSQNLTLGDDDINQLIIALSPSVFDIIKVNATPLHTNAIESALPVSVLSADELRLKQAATLGETLKNEVGVHSSYYGPVSSSPIIRGLDGPRVTITQNGLDVGDASRVGPDHAISSDASTANQIEVLRGPATLFYGSGAIGGVVNVVDNRVPHTEGTIAEWLLEHNTVANEELASLNYNTAQGSMAYHFDGFWRKSDDVELAGPAELEHDAHDEHDEQDDHDEGHADKLANSGSRSTAFTIGSSYLLDNGFVGVSYGLTQRKYDIPGHSHGDESDHEGETEEEHAEHEEHEEPTVYADMRQHRYQLISELNLDNDYLNALHSKFAYTDYQHIEFEGQAVGTTFNNKSFEGRFDLYHVETNGWSGAVNLHYKNTDFTAFGEEAFTPPAASEMLALSILEEKHFDDLLLQLGARVERINLDADPIELAHDDEHEGEHEGEDEDDHEQSINFARQTFNPFSASVGLIWEFTPGYNLAFSGSYSQRAPSASELFSLGPHVGTRSFEVGALFDMEVLPDEFHFELANTAQMETSANLDVTLRKFEGDFGFVLNAFYNRIDDFYFQQHTGELIELHHDHEAPGDEPGDDDHGEEEAQGMPILIYTQQDVKMHGFEAQVVYQLNEQLKLSGFSDYIRGETVSGSNLPRIPPLRLGAQLSYQADAYSGEISATRYGKQDNIGFGETATDGYTMVDLNFNYYLNGDLTLYMKVNNLTDRHARVHSSFLKDIVPLPGRGFSFGIRGVL